MKKRYAVAGVSNRAISMFIRPIYRSFGDVAELVGMLDIDPMRFDVCEENIEGCTDIPRFNENEFDKMVAETKPDIILVAGADFTHAGYVIGALEKGLDVVVEKPMTTTAADAKAIMDAEAKSKGKVIVTFNYRYPATHRKVKELILEGRVGKITSIDLNWTIDTHHGASYFKRWNRTRAGSGGLSIHKCSHHFDLLNWWSGEKPIETFAYGARNFYGSEGGKNPRKVDGRNCGTCPDRTECAYEMRWMPRHLSVDAKPPEDDHLNTIKPMGRHVSTYTDYRPDKCIFDSEIDIEDTYNAAIKYSNGITASYSINYSSAYEGYRLAINGTEGRIETQEHHAATRVPFAVPPQTIEVYPLFGKSGRETIDVLHGSGGHGGGDPLILEDIFLGPREDREYDILAGSEAGAYSVALGEAVWRSVVEHRPVTIGELLS
jgi:predicted dehydrogenase